MYDQPKDLIDALQATPAILEGLLHGISQEQAHEARGGDEGWSIVEVICHLRDAEERAIERVLAMRDEDAPFLPGYDQELWARERDYARSELREALASFKRFRSEHMLALAALTEPEWKRTGRHEEQGSITISSHTLHIVAHDAVHAAQIARQLHQ
jgi:hypothetical protein